MVLYFNGESCLRSEDFVVFQAEDGIRDWSVTGVQTCALPICLDLDLGPFWFGELNGKFLEMVVIKCKERTPGEYDNVPDLAGCIKGVYEAVLKDRREWLDQLRIRIALVNEYPLPLARL